MQRNHPQIRRSCTGRNLPGWRTIGVRNKLVDCNSEIESEGHVPDASGQDAKRSDSGAIASICNAAMIVAHVAGTPIFTVTVH
ncbi:hypothetical protein UNDKW_1416 [Undibacterium sp. KW1]|nr:hypothetical protein UNDKW_1416 [Undibacterium sp. KW1]